jgi:hypothetical protein
MKKITLITGLAIIGLFFMSCNQTNNKQDTNKKKVEKEEKTLELSEEETRYEKIKEDYELFGQWNINNSFTGESYDYEIYQKEGEYIGVSKFDVMSFEELKKEANKYRIKDSRFGEYYIIDSQKNMELFDQDGELESTGYTATLIE